MWQMSLHFPPGNVQKRSVFLFRFFLSINKLIGLSKVFFATNKRQVNSCHTCTALRKLK